MKKLLIPLLLAIMLLPAVVQAQLTLPYTTGFEGLTTGQLPTGWSQLQSGSSGSGTFPAAYQYANNARNGSVYFEFESTTGQTELAALPVVSDVSQLQLSFYASVMNHNFLFEVGVMDGTTFEPVDTIALTVGSGGNWHGSYNQYTVYFNNYTGSGDRMAMRTTGTGGQYTLMLDDLTVEAMPSCLAPQRLRVDSTGTNWAALGWREVGSATSWEVAYETTNFNPDTSNNVISVYDTSVVLTDLLGGHIYNAYVRSICSESSPWTGPLTFIPGQYVMGTSGSDTLRGCGYVIYDNGGPDAIYSTYSDYTVVIYPGSEDSVITFWGSTDLYAYYAQLHGWTQMYNEHKRCFDFKSDENNERMGAYDVKTAVYRFCRILGVTPTYMMGDGIEYADGRNLQAKKMQAFRNEIRNGSMGQWMAVFYHEDPNADFTVEYSYEHAVEDWLMAMGRIDPSQRYYKRFIDARDETQRRVKFVKDSWNRAKTKEKIWRTAFYSLSGIWLLFVLIFGVTNPEYILTHTFISIGLPLGGMTGLIVATRSFFKGYDFMFSFLWGLVGAFTCFIPIIILKYIGASHPMLFNIAVIVITLIYMLVCHLTDFRGNEKADSRLISEVLENDVKSNLIEPLYYTFKARSYKFKGSKFGLLNDVTDQVRSITGESVLHYVLWSLLMLVFVISFVVFSPSLLNVANPNSHMKEAPKSIIKKIDRDA